MTQPAGERADAARPATRRDRVRAATRDEIIETARRLLLEHGQAAVSLRAIAREMGMTAPGLYRYFGSHEELFRHVIAGIFTELTGDIRQAISDAARHGEDPQDEAEAKARMTAKVVAACHEFRRWSLAHKGEFNLVFGVPLPGFDDGRYDVAEECALQFAGTFFTLFFEMWEHNRFPVLSDEEIEPGLRDQLAHYRDSLGVQLPLGALLTFLRSWMLLYGAVAMEVLGHLGFALTDPSPMFDITLAEMASMVGLQYPIP